MHFWPTWPQTLIVNFIDFRPFSIKFAIKFSTKTSDQALANLGIRDVGNPGKLFKLSRRPALIRYTPQLAACWRRDRFDLDCVKSSAGKRLKSSISCIVLSRSLTRTAQFRPRLDGSPGKGGSFGVGLQVRDYQICYFKVLFS